MTGGDSLLYHALKLYKLCPELRWTAGGYVWPVDQVIDLVSESPETPVGRMPLALLAGAQSNTSSPVRATFNGKPMSASYEDAHLEAVREMVQKSGAVLLSDAGVYVLSDPALLGTVSKERVGFVQDGELEKLVVNVLLVVYVP